MSVRKSVIQTYRLAMLLAIICSAVEAWADMRIEYHASLTGQASSKSLAPYMLGSWNQGRYFEGDGIWQEAGLLKPLDTSKRFNWSVGFDYLAGVGSKTDYARWNEESSTWGETPVGRKAFRITQLFGEIKYRAVYLTVGMKNSHSLIIDDRLSSGDFTQSNNASPVPGVSAGFLDFVDIPFTKGCLQINGELMLGKMTDSDFKVKEFNHYSGEEGLHLYYSYERCYFRTNPEKRFHVTFGMQAGGLFGGTTYVYRKGKLLSTKIHGFHFKDIVQAFFPREGGEAFYAGSHLGSWDLKATYAFRNGSKLHAYFEWPWEDGSGIGRMNGFDGLWGLQYDFAKEGVVTKAVVEYLDFTNQSGPIHYSPADNPESPMTGDASGADDYYNNDFYGAYTNYGMGMGTPFLLAPIYNLNGSLDYLYNRARGFHAAVEGNPAPWVSYRLMVGYSLAGGSGWVPAFRKTHSTSAMIEGRLKPLRRIPGLEVGLTMAFDKGTLRGDNFGARLQIGYAGDFSF